MENNLNYKFIVYMTINTVNNNIYVGVHKTLTPYEFDGYLGNGIYVNRPNTYEKSKTKFQQAVKEYGPKSFKRILINVFDSEKEACELICFILNKEFLSRGNVYNLILPYTYKDKPVYSYSKEGKYLSKFKNIYSILYDLDISNKSIQDACILGNLVCDKYYFSYIKAKDFSTARTEYIKHSEVHKYDSNGAYIRSYNTYLEAQANNKESNIIKSIKLKSPDINDNIWGLVKLEYYNRPKLPTKKRKVGRFDMDNNLLEELDSATYAAKKYGSAVWHALLGRNETHKGYKFKYLS